MKYLRRRGAVGLEGARREQLRLMSAALMAGVGLGAVLGHTPAASLSLLEQPLSFMVVVLVAACLGWMTEGPSFASRRLRANEPRGDK